MEILVVLAFLLIAMKSLLGGSGFFRGFSIGFWNGFFDWLFVGRRRPPRTRGCLGCLLVSALLLFLLILIGLIESNRM